MATTINSYSVGLTLDASGYINGSKLARGEAQSLTRMINSSRTPTEQFARTYDKLENALAKGAISLGTYKRLLDEARQKLQDTEIASVKVRVVTDKLSESVKKSTTSIKSQNAELGNADKGFSALTMRVKALVAGYVGFQTLSKSLNLAIEAEQASVQFEVLTGSVKNASILLKQLREFSDVSPITYGGTLAASRTLLSFGVQVQDVTKIVRQLGDITGGNEERFKNLALAYAQATAASRLQGQDLRQMIDAGFNPLQTIAAKTGETLDQVRERMIEVGAGADLMREAFESDTEAGGRFHGMTDRLAETMGGKLAVAMSDLEKAGIKLGNTFEPIISMFTTGINDGMSMADDAIFLVEKLIDGLAFGVALGKDVRSGLAKIFTGDFTGLVAGVGDNMDDILQRIDDRNRLRIEELKSAVTDTEFDLGARGMTGAGVLGIEEIEDPKSVLKREKLALKEKLAAETILERQRTLAMRQHQKEIDAHEARRAKLYKAARAVVERNDPIEKIASQFKDLQALYSSGMLNERALIIEQKRLLGEAGKAVSEKIGGKITQPTSIEVGSQEAYKFITGQQVDKQNEQLQTMREQKILIEVQNRLLTTIADNSKPLRVRS